MYWNPLSWWVRRTDKQHVFFFFKICVWSVLVILPVSLCTSSCKSHHSWSSWDVSPPADLCLLALHKKNKTSFRFNPPPPALLLWQLSLRPRPSSFQQTHYRREGGRCVQSFFFHTIFHTFWFGYGDRSRGQISHNDNREAVKLILTI